MKPPKHAKVPRLDIVLPPSADGSSFEIFKAASAVEAEITLPEGARAQDFFLEGVTWQLPQATLSRVRASAQRVRRSPPEDPDATAPNLQICLHIASEGTFTFDNGCERFGSGDIIFCNSRRADDATIGAFDMRRLIVPQDRLPAILLSPRVHGVRLPAEAPGTRLLAAAIESLVGEIGSLSVFEADHAVMALCQLAAGMVEAHLGRLDRNRRRWADPQLDAAMAYIEEHWPDPTLSVKTLCAHLNQSRSGLYRLFAPLGGFDTAVRQRRLDYAMRALLSGIEPGLPMWKVAARHGFKTETNFIRSFQFRFGATPIQFRAALASNDRAWLTEQAGRAGFNSLQAWSVALTAGVPNGDGPQS